LVITALLLLFCLPRMFLVGVFPRWARFSECVSAVAVIAILVYGSGGGLKRVLNWRVIRFYGRISYSFYLLHPLTFLIIWKIPGPLSRLLDAGVPAVVIALGLAISSILAITPLAWLSWRFVEIPGIAAGRRLSPDRRNVSPYVSPHGRVVHESGMIPTKT
jgi:peptidoglycan/LPS O-acetylase OafA/YrhL